MIVTLTPSTGSSISLLMAMGAEAGAEAGAEVGADAGADGATGAEVGAAAGVVAAGGVLAAGAGVEDEQPASVAARETAATAPSAKRFIPKT